MSCSQWQPAQLPRTRGTQRAVGSGSARRQQSARAEAAAAPAAPAASSVRRRFMSARAQQRIIQRPERQRRSSSPAGGSCAPAGGSTIPASRKMAPAPSRSAASEPECRSGPESQVRFHSGLTPEIYSGWLRMPLSWIATRRASSRGRSATRPSDRSRFGRVGIQDKGIRSGRKVGRRVLSGVGVRGSASELGLREAESARSWVPESGPFG